MEFEPYTGGTACKSITSSQASSSIDAPMPTITQTLVNNMLSQVAADDDNMVDNSSNDQFSFNMSDLADFKDLTELCDDATFQLLEQQFSPHPTLAEQQQIKQAKCQMSSKNRSQYSPGHHQCSLVLIC